MSTPANASAAKAKKPGPKESPYSDKQEAWLDAQAEDYVKKTGPWKQIQGITNGTDDSDLSSWVSSRWDQFRKAFKPDLDLLMERKGTKIPDEHRRFTTWFQNRKEKLKREVARKAKNPGTNTQSLAASVTPEAPNAVTHPLVPTSLPSSKPFFLLEERPLTGQKHFETEIRDSVNKEIAELRKRQGLDKRVHLAMLSAELSRRWKSLTTEEQASWEMLAVTKQAEENSKQIYINQTRFLDELTVALCSLLGDGRYQIGNATFALNYAYYNEEDVLTCGTMCIKPTESSPTFRGFEPEFHSVLESKWRQFASKYLPHNSDGQSRHHYNFRFNEDKRPFFPDINEDEILLSDLRRIVSEFLNLQWESCGRAPLAQVTDSGSPEWLSAPLTNAIRDGGVSLLNPLSATTLELLSLFQHLKKLQSTTPEALQVFDTLPDAYSAPIIDDISLANVEEFVNDEPPPSVEKPPSVQAEDQPKAPAGHTADVEELVNNEKPASVEKPPSVQGEDQAKELIDAPPDVTKMAIPVEDLDKTLPAKGKDKRKAEASVGGSRQKRKKNDFSNSNPEPSTNLRRSGRSRGQPTDAEKGSTKPSIASGLPTGKNWYWAPVDSPEKSKETLTLPKRI